MIRRFALLQTFIAVARAGRMKQAAHELALTPGAVSQRIRRLEEAAGRPLFLRYPSGVELSAAGEAMSIESNVTTETRIPGLKRHLINFCCVRSIVAVTLGLSRVQNSATTRRKAASRTSREHSGTRARAAVSFARGSRGPKL